MYDQDKVFVVSENFGNVIFVPEFEEYVKETGYSIILCRPRDPQTKGKVEAMVGTVKYSFLEGRTYTGIDSLNSAALALRRGTARSGSATTGVAPEHRSDRNTRSSDSRVNRNSGAVHHSNGAGQGTTTRAGQQHRNRGQSTNARRDLAKHNGKLQIYGTEGSEGRCLKNRVCRYPSDSEPLVVSLSATRLTRRFTEQSDRLEAKTRKWHKAAAAIILLSSVGRAHDC